MNIVNEYISYLYHAKGKHGVHSPFVYDFLDNCLSIKIDSRDKEIINKWRSNLKNDHTKLTIADFGAGSKKLGNERTVSQIFKVSSTSKKYSSLLYKIAKHYQPKKVLELGTSLGTGSLHMHLGCRTAKIFTVEGCVQTAQKAREHLHRSVKTENITILESTFEKALQKVDSSLDMIFIDGHHESKAMMNILRKLESNIHDETIIIFDDIRWNADMKELWNFLIKNEKFHLSMDLFRMGIILCRAHQQKEHFVIRY